MNTNKNNEVSKLNNLLREWPKGAVITFSRLKEKGYSRQLIDKYKSSRWLEVVNTGAYKRYKDTIDWYGGLYGLQRSNLDIHAGAKSALELQGFAHYLAPKMPRVFLFGPPQTRLPKWFSNYQWGLDIIFTATKLFKNSLKTGFTEYSHKEFSVWISAPERAALEMMYHIPDKQGFGEAYRILENMTTLRPDLVQELLMNCHSVKVKRLFMYMAEKAEHTWVEELSPEKVDFGSGKRVIVKNGIFDKKYQITVEAESNL
ncbi:MAG: type IV toxin-antitoxin system AbiEi family antitoxin domain-containing protein [bacterium]